MAKKKLPVGSDPVRERMMGPGWVDRGLGSYVLEIFPGHVALHLHAPGSLAGEDETNKDKFVCYLMVGFRNEDVEHDEVGEIMGRGHRVAVEDTLEDAKRASLVIAQRLLLRGLDQVTHGLAQAAPAQDSVGTRP